MTASPSEIARLYSCLGAMLGTVESIVALPSGSSGTSYRVEAATGRFVAKAFRSDAKVLLGPAAQFALFARLAKVGLAPVPAGFDRHERILVTEFVADGTAVSASELRQPERIERLAAALNLLHGLPADIPPYAPRACAERYLAEIGGVACLSAGSRERFEELLSLSADFDQAATTLCHNDLAAENVLFGTAIRFIDFDYAVSASPILDLASVVVMNGFATAEAHALIAAYFSGSIPFSETEFARVQRLVCLLAHFWSLASADAGTAIVAQYRINDV
jgi:Ser/Thr protein kinase RdoA (MazF antagonist)